MTTKKADVLRTFALRGKWHIVHDDRIVGPVVGPLYLFKCARWARETNVEGIARGASPVGGEPCMPCHEVEEGLLSNTSGVPGPFSEGPWEPDWNPDSAPNRAAFLKWDGSMGARELDPEDTP
jgi:hypothetical protein